MASFFDFERERKVRVLEMRIDLWSARSKAPTVMDLSGDLAAPDAETVISALASLLHLASDPLGGIDPDHTERSLAGLAGPPTPAGSSRSTGPERVAVLSYLELASITDAIVALRLPLKARGTSGCNRRRRRARTLLARRMTPVPTFRRP